jgi:outer membrane lipoprotein-sorting protein
MIYRLILFAMLAMLCFGGCTSKQPSGGGAKEPAAGVEDEKTAAAPFQDESAAHELYNQMIEAIRKAKSLSYVSHYRFKREDYVRDCVYRAWLKKPNYFHLETEGASMEKNTAPEKGGVLIGDGDTLWIFWPQGRPRFSFDLPDSDEKTRFTSYMRSPAPLAEHSIGHHTRWLGNGMSGPVLDPSMFHGYADCLLSNIEGVKGLGTEKIGGEDCDQIEVSILQYQRTWRLWLSKTDHLPRKLQSIRWLSPKIAVTETWSSVSVDADMPTTLFKWKPPVGKVVAASDGSLTIHYELQHKDGAVLKGDLPFHWSKQSKQWIGSKGLDWHLHENP